MSNRRTSARAAAAGAGRAAWVDPGDAEGRVAELARSRGQLRRVLAGLAAALVARKGWEPLGYVRAGDYARERLGLSGRSLHDLARVGRALAGLPRLEAALVSGALPWSKVRLLARFAAAGDEAPWIALARGLGVRALERRVRAVDRGAFGAAPPDCDEDGASLEPLETVQLRVGSAVYFKWQRTQAWAACVAGEPAPAGAVLEMVTAETLSALPAGAGPGEPGGLGGHGSAPAWRPGLEAGLPAADVCAHDAAGREAGAAAANVCAHHAAGREAGAGAADVCAHYATGREVPGVAPVRAAPGSPPEPAVLATGCEPPRPLPAFLRPLVAGLEAADAFELDARLRRAVRLEQRLDAEIAPLLRQATAADRAWRGRHGTLAAFAREHLGMSPRKARALVRLDRVGDVCPELRAAWRDGTLSWVQAQTLAPLFLAEASGDWRAGWIRFARQVTVRRLDEVVGRALTLRETEPELWEVCRGAPERACELEERAGAAAAGRRCLRSDDRPRAPELGGR